jgi:uncharacterized protein YaeQ
MSAGARTLQVRLVVSAVDRGLEVNTKLVVPRRDDEGMTHVVLRVLAFCLFCGEHGRSGELRLAPGPADRDGPDLWSHDLAGRPVEWIICGAPDLEELRYVLQHQRQAQIRILLGSDEERERLLAGIHAFRRPLERLRSVDVRQVDARLLEALAQRDEERQRWLVTVVEGHVYVEHDGQGADGEVTPVPMPSEEALRR